MISSEIREKIEKNENIIYEGVKDILLKIESSSELSIANIINNFTSELDILYFSYKEIGNSFYPEHYICGVLEDICIDEKIILKESMYKNNKEKMITIIFKDKEAELILFLIKYYNFVTLGDEENYCIELPFKDEDKVLDYFDLDSSFIYKIEKLGICSNNNTERIIKFGNYNTNYFNLKNRKNIEENISARIEIDRIISLKELTKNSKNKIEELEKNTENKISSFEKSLTKVEKLISNAENDIDSFHKSVEKTKFDLVAVLGVFVCIFTLISVNVNTTKSFFESEVKFDVVMMLLYSNWVMIFSLGTLVLFIKYILIYSRKENSVLIGLFLWLIMFIGTALIYYLLKTDFLRIIQHYNFLILNK